MSRVGSRRVYRINFRRVGGRRGDEIYLEQHFFLEIRIKNIKNEHQSEEKNRNLNGLKKLESGQTLLNS